MTLGICHTKCSRLFRPVVYFNPDSNAIEAGMRTEYDILNDNFINKIN